MARAQVRTAAPAEQEPAAVAEETEVPEIPGGDTIDSPILDLSDAAVKRMIKLAKARGYVTLDELNAVLPSEETSTDQIEDVYAMLSEMGISVVESEEESDNLANKVEAEQEAESSETALIKVEAASCRPTAPMIRCACICVRWGRWSCCRAKAKSPSPSASRLAARP